MRKATSALVMLTTVSAAALLGACKGSADSKGSTASSTSSNAAIQPSGDSTISLNGAGATFPFPLYSKWIAEYGKANPKVKVNYQSVGSGAGIKQISDRTVDFGGSDAPMNDEQLGKAPGKIL